MSTPVAFASVGTGRARTPSVERMFFTSSRMRWGSESLVM